MWQYLALGHRKVGKVTYRKGPSNFNLLRVRFVVDLGAFALSLQDADEKLHLNMVFAPKMLPK